MSEAAEKYRFTADMDEMTGLGGDYEACTREALRGALLWLEANPGPTPQFLENPQVFGITLNDDRMDAALLAGNDAAKARFGPEYGLTGAMAHCIAGHVRFIAKHGWDAYCVKMLREGGAS